MPEVFRQNITYKKLPRGVSNRVAGLQWIFENGNPDGVLYFADDDNTYDFNLFTDVCMCLWTCHACEETLLIKTSFFADSTNTDSICLSHRQYEGYSGGHASRERWENYWLPCLLDGQQKFSPGYGTVCCEGQDIPRVC